MPNILDNILTHNEQFVKNKEFEQYQTNKFPDKRLVILTCMDTRLTELLHRAINIKNGDVKIIKNAGAIVSHPFGSIMRSILVAIYELNAQEVCVVGHYDCGMNYIRATDLKEKMLRDGHVTAETIAMLKYSGVDVHSWLKGFDSVEESVKNSVDMIHHHPLIPASTPVHGLIIDPNTGKLDVVVNGYEASTTKDEDA